MKFLVGPALNSRNFQRRNSNRSSVVGGMPTDGSWGEVGAYAAEDGRVERQATQGNDRVLSAARFMQLHKQKSRLDINKNPCICSLKNSQRSMCCPESCSRSLNDGKATCELAPCSQRCPWADTSDLVTNCSKPIRFAFLSSAWQHTYWWSHQLHLNIQTVKTPHTELWPAATYAL